jgi:hypothetical protein
MIAVRVGLAFLRCGGANPPAATRSIKTPVTHHRIKIKRVYRPYLTALGPGWDGRRESGAGAEESRPRDSSAVETRTV